MTSAANAAPSFLFPSTGFDANKQRPKSPKSPKVLTIDNPLLKSPQFLFGGGRTAANSAAPSLRPENDQQQSQARSPLLSVSVNRPRPTQRTPGPPPKASLSLMGMLPVEATPTVPTPAINSMTPPPIASPRLLWGQHSARSIVNEVSAVAPTSDTNNWIVAFGYSHRDEYQELVRILNGYGLILQQQSNGNWLAVKYESRLAAEKALCSQPIRLSPNSLCGTVRGTPQLLQSLQDQQRNESSLKTLAKSSSALTTPASASPSTDTIMNNRSNVLEEKDILAQYDDVDSEGSQIRSKSDICGKLLGWFFEWDNAHHHPHSD